MKPHIRETSYIVTNYSDGKNYKPSQFHSLDKAYDFIAELITGWDMDSESSRQLCNAVRDAGDVNTKKEILETSPHITHKLEDGYVLHSDDAEQVIQIFEYENTCHCKSHG